MHLLLHTRHRNMLKKKIPVIFDLLLLLLLIYYSLWKRMFSVQKTSKTKMLQTVQVCEFQCPRVVVFVQRTCRVMGVTFSIAATSMSLFTAWRVWKVIHQEVGLDSVVYIENNTQSQCCLCLNFFQSFSNVVELKKTPCEGYTDFKQDIISDFQIVMLVKNCTI